MTSCKGIPTLPRVPFLPEGSESSLLYLYAYMSSGRSGGFSPAPRSHLFPERKRLPSEKVKIFTLQCDVQPLQLTDCAVYVKFFSSASVAIVLMSLSCLVFSFA